MSENIPETKTMINEAVSILDEAFSRHDKLVLAYSGGKDSNTIFDLIFQYFKDKVNKLKVCCYLSPLEPREMEELVYEKKKYIDIIINYSVNWIEFMFERGYYLPTVKSRWCTGIVKINPQKNSIEGKAIVGVRKHESKKRSMAFKNNSYDDVITPIMNWHDEHVWDYLLNYSPLSEINKKLKEVYDKNNARRMGCIVCPIGNKCYYDELKFLHEFIYKVANKVSKRETIDEYCNLESGVAYFKHDILVELLRLIREAERAKGIQLLRYTDEQALEMYREGVQKRIERKLKMKAKIAKQIKSL